MAGKVGARQFTQADKAQALVTLAANGGNIKRTARDLGVNPNTVRRWRTLAETDSGPDKALVAVAIKEFVGDAERVRNKALGLLEARIDAGEIKAGELITALGVLDDKITRSKGLPTSTVNHQSALPSPEELRGLMTGFVAGAIAAAEERQTIIVDAELVEEIPPPSLAPPAHPNR